MSPKKTAKMRVAQTIDPFNAIVLTVDTARHSGWAIHVAGDLHVFGCDDIWVNPLATEQVCAKVASWADRDLPAVMVMEAPWRGTQQGAERGTWRNGWLRSGLPRSRVLEVQPSEWRTVLGVGFARASREAARRREIEFALGFLDEGVEIHPDEAAAISMGQWAITAKKVGKRLPKSIREATRGYSE